MEKQTAGLSFDVSVTVITVLQHINTIKPIVIRNNSADLMNNTSVNEFNGPISQIKT